MNPLVAREISPEDYAAFLARAPHSAFHRLPWLHSITRVYPVRLTTLGFFNGARLIAVTPLLRRRMGPFELWGAPLRKCAMPPATPCCSPPNRATDIIPALRLWARQRRIRYLQLCLPLVEEAGDPIVPGPPDRLEPFVNLERDLQRPLAALWSALPKKSRYLIRKAVRSGVRIHCDHSPTLLQTQASLLQATYARQGPGMRPNFPLELYRILLSRREQQGLLILSAHHQGQCVARIWVFTDADSCHYWDAASLPAARDLNANHLLLWCLTRWAHRHGLRTLDFIGGIGGRGDSRPGIGHFKRSLGATPRSYVMCYWYTPLLRLAFASYRLFHRLSLYRQKRTPRN